MRHDIRFELDTRRRVSELPLGPFRDRRGLEARARERKTARETRIEVSAVRRVRSHRTNSSLLASLAASRNIICSESSVLSLCGGAE